MALKSESEDNNERSCTWFRKKVSHEIYFKAVGRSTAMPTACEFIIICWSFHEKKMHRQSNCVSNKDRNFIFIYNWYSYRNNNKYYYYTVQFESFFTFRIFKAQENKVLRTGFTFIVLNIKTTDIWIKNYSECPLTGPMHWPRITPNCVGFRPIS